MRFCGTSCLFRTDLRHVAGVKDQDYNWCNTAIKDKLLNKQQDIQNFFDKLKNGWGGQ